jgi:hypothetical protein
MQTVVEIYEVGTGKMTFNLEQNFVVTKARWSTNGNYLSVASCQNRQYRIFQSDEMSQDNIWTLKDRIKHNSKFWTLFPIDLNQVAMDTA